MDLDELTLLVRKCRMFRSHLFLTLLGVFLLFDFGFLISLFLLLLKTLCLLLGLDFGLFIFFDLGFLLSLRLGFGLEHALALLLSLLKEIILI